MPGINIVNLFGGKDGQDDGQFDSPILIPSFHRHTHFICSICSTHLRSPYLYQMCFIGQGEHDNRLCMDCVAAAVGGKPCQA